MELVQLKNDGSKNANNGDKTWKYCPFCGEEIQKEWKVCSFCGNALLNRDKLKVNDCKSCKDFVDEPYAPIYCRGSKYCSNRDQLERLEIEKREKRIEENRERRWNEDKPRRIEFIKQMSLFLEKHGTEKINVNDLLWYAVRKLDSGFNEYGVSWHTDSEGIQYRKSWASHSYFDDGSGEQGDYNWSFTFVGDEAEQFKIENEKLKDMSRYIVETNIPTTDVFYCQNPFGLKGIYRIQYDGRVFRD